MQCCNWIPSSNHCLFSYFRTVTKQDPDWMLPSITHLVWTYIATALTKKFFRIESPMQLDSPSAGNFIFHRQDIHPEGEWGWMIPAIATAMVTLPMKYLVSLFQRELCWSSSFWAAVVHGADGEPQYYCKNVMEAGASSVLFFLILEANPTLSIIGLNKPSANTSAYLVREKSNRSFWRGEKSGIN